MAHIEIILLVCISVLFTPRFGFGRENSSSELPQNASENLNQGSPEVKRLRVITQREVQVVAQPKTDYAGLCRVAILEAQPKNNTEMLAVCQRIDSPFSLAALKSIISGDWVLTDEEVRACVFIRNEFALYSLERIVAQGYPLNFDLIARLGQVHSQTGVTCIQDQIKNQSEITIDSIAKCSIDVVDWSF